MLAAARALDPLARDFGGLCRCQADNAALRRADTKVRVVFLGDSITENWIRADPELFGPGIIDRGISGQTSAQMLVRFRQDVIDLHPRIVHILAGANDLAGFTGPTTLEAIEANIVSTAELAVANHIRVVIASVLPAARYPWRPAIAPAIGQLNAFLKVYASRHRVQYVDYHALLVNAEGGMSPADAQNGVHPTAEAYRRMRPLAEAAIKG